MKTTMQRMLLSGAVAGLMALSTQAQSPLADAQIEKARNNYKAELWPAGQVRDGISVGTLEIPGYRGGELEARKGLISRSFYAADAPKDAAPAFLVKAQVFDTPAEAQDDLVLFLAGISSPVLAPTATQRGFQVGETAFVGPSGAGAQAFSWVAFVRGNVSLKVMTFDPRATPELPVPTIAQAVDAAALGRPVLARGAKPLRPTIPGFTAGLEEVVAGTPIPLDVSVVDPAGGLPHLAWTVGGPGQGYVEQRGEQWFLFTTGPGEIDLTLHVTASTGTTAESTVHVSVADD